MDEVKSKSRTRSPNFDRIQLSCQNCEKLKTWMTQISANLNGVRVSKNEIVNWFLTSIPVELKPTDLSKLGNDFFDELAFTQWVVEEVKRRKKSGEKFDLHDLISAPRKKVLTRSRKMVKTAEGDDPNKFTDTNLRS